MGAILSVHDCQLVDDIPVEKLLIHDVPVDIICTPTQVIFTNTSIPKPQGTKQYYLIFCIFVYLREICSAMHQVNIRECALEILKRRDVVQFLYKKKKVIVLFLFLFNLIRQRVSIIF